MLCAKGLLIGSNVALDAQAANGLDRLHDIVADLYRMENIQRFRNEA